MKKSNFKLEEVIDLYNLPKYHKKALKALAKKPDVIAIDASMVESIKTPGIQFLVSFVQTAQKNDISVIFKEPTDLLIRILGYLGLENLLETKE